MRKAPATTVTRVQSFEFDPTPYLKGSLKAADVVQIKQTFDSLDIDKVGSINPRQIKAAFQSLGDQATQHPVYQLICDYDAEGKGNIGFEDFLHLMTHRVTERDSREDFAKVFALFDDEKTGYLSVTNLRRVIKHIGEQVPEQTLQDLIDAADTDRDGFVSVEEFYRVMTRAAF